MPKFGKKSLEHYKTCSENIQLVLDDAIKIVDFSIIWGHRGQLSQNKAYADGYSTKKWPMSKHNVLPSVAVDVVPYPSGWPQKEDPPAIKAAKIAHFNYVAGVIMTCAKLRGITLRWGGDWDMDNDFLDNKFDDLGHFEEV